MNPSPFVHVAARSVVQFCLVGPCCRIAARDTALVLPLRRQVLAMGNCACMLDLAVSLGPSTQLPLPLLLSRPPPG